MKAQWQQFNEREQGAILISGLFLIAYLSYASFFSPLSKMVTTAQKRWHEQTVTLTWMLHVQQNYHEEKKPQKVASSNLLSILTEVLDQASFNRFAYQLEQTATGDIQLSFENVPYNGFMEWLRDQSAQYTLSIKNLDVTKTNINGVVTVSVIFGAE